MQTTFEPSPPFERDTNNNDADDASAADAGDGDLTYRQQRHSIKEFYNGAIVLVTGGTGFLGKVLIEKLLRTCGQVRSVYVLLRAKKGRSSEERYTEFIQNPIFDRIRAKDPSLLCKLICVSGDISQPLIGLADAERQRLQDTVDIVFHSAATVRFDQPLKDAANLNTLGSQRLFDLCTGMKRLKSFVHVSTAFCNPQRRDVEETVYPAKLQLDVGTFMQCVNVLPAPVVDSIALSLQGPHPNTYTLTKSMAEQIAAEYHHRLPICIVRPSIVTAAIAEPFPGWVDNVNGITGIMMEIGRGTISSIMCDRRLVMDLIPVDIVCNMMITSAWHNYNNPSNAIRVYNCTSGQMNPVVWSDYGRITLKYARQFPSKYVLLYPNFTYRTNRVVHRFYELFFHFLPAIGYDLLLRHKGLKPMLFNIAKRYKTAADTGEYFARHEWNFETTNVRELLAEVQAAKDGAEFRVDVRAMVWDEYIREYMLGIRKFVLKDDVETLPAARATVRKFLVVKWCMQLMLLGLAYGVVMAMYSIMHG